MRLLERVYSGCVGTNRARRYSVPRLIISLAIIGVMIGSSFRSIRGGLTGPIPHSIDPSYSTDAYLQVLTGVPKASQRVSDLMAALPREKPVLIFERERDASSSLLGMTLAYLSWPGAVRIELVRGNNCDRQLGAVAPDSVAAVAFCDLAAPTWVQGGIRLGRTSRLLPLESANETTR